MTKIVEEKKKRGRKPKNVNPEIQKPVEKKKRGRKPKSDLSTTLIKNNKNMKKEKSYGNKNSGEVDFSSENIILHLPVHSDDIIDTTLSSYTDSVDTSINIPKENETIGLKNMNLTWIQPKNVEQPISEFASYPFKKMDSVNNNNEKLLNNNNSIDKNSLITDNSGKTNADNIDYNSNMELSKLKEFRDSSINEINNINHNTNNIYDNNHEIMGQTSQWNISNTIKTEHMDGWYQSENLDYSNEVPYDKKIDNLMKPFVESTKNNKWPMNTNISCFWCCHKFQCRPCALPIRYDNGKYKVYGCFCSPECAAAYNFNDLQDTDMRWERYSLLNLMYKKNNTNSNLKIKLAPPRQCLNMFGGPLSIQQFRDTLENYNKTYVLNFPPMVSINIQQEQINLELNNYNNKDLSLFIPVDQERVSEANENLKLKRKKPVSEAKNTLETCMNLQFK